MEKNQWCNFEQPYRQKYALVFIATKRSASVVKCIFRICASERKELGIGNETGCPRAAKLCRIGRILLQGQKVENNIKNYMILYCTKMVQ